MSILKVADNFRNASYAELMSENATYIELKIETKQPIEVVDFVSTFLSLSSQYDKFIRANYPDISPDAKIFVKQVREGSIIAELIANISPMWSEITNTADTVNTYVQFVGYVGRVSAYFQPGGRQRFANKSELKDWMQSVEAIAHDSDGRATLSVAKFHDKKREICASFEFDTKSAQTAVLELEHHRLEIEHASGADHERVLMVFRQSNTKDTEIGKRTGERVVIEAISAKDLPLVYASDLSEQKIKHEIREADDNVYKKGFIVDVNVQTRNGKPAAYRVTNLHQVIDLPDE